MLRIEAGDVELAAAIKERRWRELSVLSDRERALLAVAEKLSGQPSHMVEQDWESLRRVGFDDTLDWNLHGALFAGGWLEAVNPISDQAMVQGVHERRATPGLGAWFFDMGIGLRSDIAQSTVDLIPLTIVADGAFLLKSDVLREKMGAGCAD